MNKGNPIDKKTLLYLKEIIGKKDWGKFFFIYYAKKENLPSLPSFLIQLQDEEVKAKIIKFLTFKENNPLLKKARILNFSFFENVLYRFATNSS